VLLRSKYGWSENASNNGTIAEFTAPVCKETASKRTAWNRVSSAITGKKKMQSGNYLIIPHNTLIFQSLIQFHFF
jgi:hypothetical protein